MNNPKISIIIPVYNAERYLRQCLDSILAQTYPDWECILVDDGSKDSSGDICDEYTQKDSRFRVFHKDNGGVSSARNLGLDNAKGEWITFSDADDWLASNAFYEYNNATIDGKADIIRAGYVRKFEDGSYNKVCSDSTFDITDKAEMLNQMERTTYYGFLWNSYYRAAIIETLRFEKDICWCEDHLFSLQCYANSCLIRYIPSVAYNYRVNSTGSLSIPRDALMIVRVANKELDAKLHLHGTIDGATSETWYIYYRKLYLAIFTSIIYGGFKAFRDLYSQSVRDFQENTNFSCGMIIKLFKCSVIPPYLKYLMIKRYGREEIQRLQYR